MKVYYNEFDPKKAAALKQLIMDGHISKGEVDERSITNVQPGDLEGFTRCHFFAGIGLWEYALDLAGWPKDRPVWTGSCPCQPFSTAGRQRGKADDRHLWPEWLRLIRERKPTAIFGEQVASAIAKGWLDDVYQGLEAEGYAVGAVVLPAASVGSPHRRDRLLFVGLSESIGLQGERQQSCARRWKAKERHSDVSGRAIWPGKWESCLDGKKRLVEPGIPLLAHGYPERVGVIHCAGDAIVPQVAAEFIKAAMDFQENSG